jgi:hypothetical protein
VVCQRIPERRERIRWIPDTRAEGKVHGDKPVERNGREKQLAPYDQPTVMAGSTKRPVAPSRNGRAGNKGQGRRGRLGQGRVGQERAGQEPLGGQETGRTCHHRHHHNNNTNGIRGRQASTKINKTKTNAGPEEAARTQCPSPIGMRQGCQKRPAAWVG